VGKGEPGKLDAEEPRHVAQQCGILTSRIRITSVNRDDLPDGGAAHWSERFLQVAREPGMSAHMRGAAVRQVIAIDRSDYGMREVKMPHCCATWTWFFRIKFARFALTHPQKPQ